MSDTANRILVALAMLGVVLFAIFLEKFGIPGIYWLGVLVSLAMILEFMVCLWRAPRNVMFNGKNVALFLGFLVLLGLDFVSMLTLGHRPMMLLMILVIICATDICAWFFGRQIGGDKMWERISEHKTWAGQIFGIIGGTAAAIAYGHMVLGMFVSQLFWIGIGIALLSQYGDLTASFVKRRLKIKDFSHVLGGHGGIIDRFDGWIYVLPIILAMLA